MAIFLTAFLIVAIVAGLFFLARHQRTPARARKAARRKTNEFPDAGTLEKLRQNKFFWGVELWQPGCAASYELLGQQFTFDNAPQIPIAECTRETCTCQFKGLRDRRTRPRRIQPDRRDEVRFDRTHPDRRKNAGRRRGDLWVSHTL
jgi:hypothetical protein